MTTPQAERKSDLDSNRKCGHCIELHPGILGHNFVDSVIVVGHFGDLGDFDEDKIVMIDNYNKIQGMRKLLLLEVFVLGVT